MARFTKSGAALSAASLFILSSIIGDGQWQCSVRSTRALFIAHD